MDCNTVYNILRFTWINLFVKANAEKVEWKDTSKLELFANSSSENWEKSWWSSSEPWQGTGRME